MNQFEREAVPGALRRSTGRTDARQRVTKGAGSRSAGLAMAFKLMQSAQRSWRRLDAHELIPLVRAGVRFVDGKQQERKKGPSRLAALALSEKEAREPEAA